MTGRPVLDEGLVHDDLGECFVDQGGGDVETVLEILLVVVVDGFLDDSMDGVDTIVLFDQFSAQELVDCFDELRRWGKSADD